jgi:septal ring factor EnvC (AmiA/AmiB activator)
VLAIDHPGRSIVSVIADLEAVLVAPGQEVAAGQPVARAAGTSIHLEIRLRTGGFGHPVDPAPLLDR